jgi:predicted hydrocarbon binding protein
MSVDPRNVILARISTGLSDMPGKMGAHATMRDMGNHSSPELFPDWPTGLGADEACTLLSDALSNIGTFEQVSLQPEGDEVAIKVRGCEFNHLGQVESQPVGQRAICFFGFGLIEKSLERLTGKQYRVELLHHDAAADTCHEIARFR